MENEQAVVEALGRADKEVLGQVYDQYGPALFGLAIRLTESETRASEVLQNAFRQMSAQAKQFDAKKTDFFSWALEIVKQVAQEVGSERDQFDFTAYQISHPAGADFKQLSKDLEEKHRKAIELAYFESLSEPELEKAMNFPVGTVNTRLRFAVRELRRVLK